MISVQSYLFNGKVWHRAYWKLTINSFLTQNPCTVLAFPDFTPSHLISPSISKPASPFKMDVNGTIFNMFWNFLIWFFHSDKHMPDSSAIGLWLVWWCWVDVLVTCQETYSRQMQWRWNRKCHGNCIQMISLAVIEIFNFQAPNSPQNKTLHGKYRVTKFFWIFVVVWC